MTKVLGAYSPFPFHRLYQTAYKYQGGQACRRKTRTPPAQKRRKPRNASFARFSLGRGRIFDRIGSVALSRISSLHPTSRSRPLSTAHLSHRSLSSHFRRRLCSRAEIRRGGSFLGGADRPLDLSAHLSPRTSVAGKKHCHVLCTLLRTASASSPLFRSRKSDRCQYQKNTPSTSPIIDNIHDF